MALGITLGVGGGASATTGSGSADTGYTSPQPPGMRGAYATPSLASAGTTWVVVGAVAWLALMYLHFHTY
jgi:hypothetical protein